MSTFRIIKETTGRICVVRSNCYGSSIRFLGELAAAAKEDFPALEDEDLEVKLYGGSRYKGTFGVEFRLPEGAEAPESYARTRELEKTL